MVGSGGSDQGSSSSQLQQQNCVGESSTNGSAVGWGWQPRRGMRGGFYPGPRRGLYMRAGGGFFPGPRGYAIPPQQNFYNQRKVRPGWRTPRPPTYGGAVQEGCMPGYQPVWPTQPSQQASSAEDCTGEEPPTKKKKRASNGSTRPWNREAAERALAVEAECQKNAGSNAIVIRFPDPELSKEIVQKLHPTIENVHFQAPCGARYCFVTLAPEANVDKVMTEISKIKFGVGTLVAERKVTKNEENVGPENIDPFTLYVGNLPTNISTLEVKEKFPSASRIDVGYAQKMKYTRYAFVRYATAEAALEAYRASVNTVIASRSIILRFRRHKAPVGPPGEKPAPSIIEAKPGEKLTVGAKLKAKKEKAKAEKAIREAKLKKKKKTEGDDDESDDEEVELENDDTESEDLTEEEEDDDDDDDDDDDEPDDEEEDDDEEEIEEDDEPEEDDDPDDEDDAPHDDDDDYLDDDYKDVDFFRNVAQMNTVNWNGPLDL